MTITEFELECNLKLERTQSNFYWCTTADFEIEVTTDNESIIRMISIYTHAYSYPDGSDESCMYFANEDIPYAINAIEFLMDPIEGTIKYLKAYLKALERFSAFMLPIFEQYGYYVLGESTFSDVFLRNNMCPCIRLSHSAPKDCIEIVYDMFKDKLFSYDCDISSTNALIKSLNAKCNIYAGNSGMR